MVATAGFKRRGRFVDRVAVVTEAVRKAGTPILILKPASDADQPVPDAVDWHEVSRAEPTGPDAEPMASDDTYMVFFTSGTTGAPKGIVHTHGGFPLKILHDSFIHFDMKRDDTYFWAADMGWIAGALGIAASLMLGASMVVYDGAPDFPDWSRMSQMIARHRVSVLGAAPTMIRGFAANEAAATAGDLTSLRILITGGEALDPEHFAWYERTFGHDSAPLINYAGGTEASGGLVSSVIVKPIPRRRV